MTVSLLVLLWYAWLCLLLLTLLSPWLSALLLSLLLSWALNIQCRIRALWPLQLRHGWCFSEIPLSGDVCVSVTSITLCVRGVNPAVTLTRWCA